jgi:hypothetical protein
MIKRQLIAIALLATLGSLALAKEAGKEAGKTDPESGKSCVTFLAAERTTNGLVKMYYRNICATPFEIQIMTEDATRTGTIKAGTPKKPAKTSIICKSADECDRSDWKYE